MMEAKFQSWLEQRFPPPVGTAVSRLSNCKRVEEAQGDLDEHYDKDRMASLFKVLMYSMDDKRAGRQNPSNIPHTSPPAEPRSGLASSLARVSRCWLIGSCFRDQPYSDVEHKVRPGPAEHDRKPIAYADQEEDVHGAPKTPCRRAGDLHPSKIRNRAPTADRGQAALVAIAKRRRRFAAAQPGSQNRGYVGAALLRRRRKPGNRLVIPGERKRGIADRKDVAESRS
jgi:hypothetical protein